jgi:hypothetical protein
VVQHFQLDIPLPSLFQSPTVAALAAVITEHKEKMPDETRPAIILDELESLSAEDVTRILDK